MSVFDRAGWHTSSAKREQSKSKTHQSATTKYMKTVLLFFIYYKEYCHLMSFFDHWLRSPVITTREPKVLIFIAESTDLYWGIGTWLHRVYIWSLHRTLVPVLVESTQPRRYVEQGLQRLEEKPFMSPYLVTLGTILPWYVRSKK